MHGRGINSTAGSPTACVIGDPVAHSRSPLIHGYWLNELGLEGAYDKRRVSAAELDDFLDEVRNGLVRGANVTVPHKEEVAKKVDRLTDTAQRLGAVNTVWVEDGFVWGDNTDVTGFLANLDEQCSRWDRNPGKAVVLGAGGAARAIIYGLLKRHFREIVITNRSIKRAEDIVATLEIASSGSLIVADWESRSEALEGASFLVNTTSLGMMGQPALEIDLAKLSPHAVVHDIVYSPLETELLKDARGRGLSCVDGLGMLLHQAAPGFARWFGEMPKVTPTLRDLVIGELNRSRA